MRFRPLVLSLALSSAVLAPALLTGCEKSAQGEKSYDAKGVVKEIEGKSLTIAHEDIPGFMKAMTMSFEAGAGVDVASIKAKDNVKFQFKKTGGKFVISKISKVK